MRTTTYKRGREYPSAERRSSKGLTHHCLFAGRSTARGCVHFSDSPCSLLAWHLSLWSDRVLCQHERQQSSMPSVSSTNSLCCVSDTATGSTGLSKLSNFPCKFRQLQELPHCPPPQSALTCSALPCLPAVHLTYDSRDPGQLKLFPPSSYRLERRVFQCGDVREGG